MINMAKFKCLRSGNFVEFHSSEDIDCMRLEEGFVEVFDAPVVEAIAEPTELISNPVYEPKLVILPEKKRAKRSKPTKRLNSHQW